MGQVSPVWVGLIVFCIILFSVRLSSRMLRQQREEVVMVYVEPDAIISGGTRRLQKNMDLIMQIIAEKASDLSKKTGNDLEMAKAKQDLDNASKLLLLAQSRLDGVTLIQSMLYGMENSEDLEYMLAALKQAKEKEKDASIRQFIAIAQDELGDITARSPISDAMERASQMADTQAERTRKAMLDVYRAAETIKDIATSRHPQARTVANTEVREITRARLSSNPVALSMKEEEAMGGNPFGDGNGRASTTSRGVYMAPYGFFMPFVNSMGASFLSLQDKKRRSMAPFHKAPH